MINCTIEPLQLSPFTASSAWDIITAAPLPPQENPIESKERAFKPYFSPMTGRPWQPTQLDYLDQVYLNIPISKFKFQILNFKFQILNFKFQQNFKFQIFEFQILNFEF